MSNSIEIQTLETQIKQAKATMTFGSALTSLQNSRDYKTVFRDGYFSAEAIRLVNLKADPSMQSVASQESIVKQMDAIGALAQFFQAAHLCFAQAARDLSANEEVLTELLQEEGAA
jgi:hypothetical protein